MGDIVDWSEVRRALLAMAARDLNVREELAADGSLFHRYHPRMQAVHDANAARLAATPSDQHDTGHPNLEEKS